MPQLTLLVSHLERQQHKITKKMEPTGPFRIISSASILSVPPVPLLMASAGATGVLGLLLFFRMVFEVHRALPPERKFPLSEYRSHYHEIIQLHKDFFPRSGVRIAWQILRVICGIMIIFGLILGLQK
jgi:hypothetical protein